MKTYSAPVLAAIASGQIAIVQFVHMAFSTPIALNMSTWDLPFGGVTYKGAYGLGTISPVNDKPGEVQGLTLMLFGDTSAIALALDDSDKVQGTALTIRTALIETVNYTVLDAPIDWSGELDTMLISEDGQQCTIQVSAESRAVDLLRGNPSFYNDSEQRLIDPNDGSFLYVTDQVDKQVTWPARAFFFQ